ncbi:MAG TPA: hypothetical protein VJM08_17910, partial [Anaerolineales bacterium]|nr:hypothetical protein [Anaerolineales bacterium]
MRKKNRHSSFLLLLILGIGVPGFIGILGVQAKAFPNQPEMLDAMLQIADTSTPTMTSTLLASTSTNLPPSNLLTPSGIFSLGLHAFIQAPSGVVSQPYVILRAFSSLPRTEEVTIRGFVNSQEFICTQFPCIIYIQSDARFVFRAFTDSGATSEEVIASVRVTQTQGGYQVTIESVSQFTTFSDACSLTWGVQDETNATWDSFVQFPFELNTRKTLHSLATQLILNGIVDTRDCPAGGLNLSMDWPTACGLERASSAMIEWQNQYDEYIWLASRNHGIP